MPVGTATEVADATPATTAWLGADFVSTIDWNQEVLVYCGPSEFTLYSPTDAACTWAAVASNTVDTSNFESYGILASDDGGPTFVLNNDNPAGCTNVGSCLLGGRHDSNQWTVILGIGGFDGGNGVAQSPTCASSSFRGFYSSGWHQNGYVYVR